MKKFKAGPKKLSEAALFFAKVLESRVTKEQMEEAFEGLEPIINKEGNKEFFLCSNEEIGFAIFLEMAPDNIWIEATSDNHYAKTNIGCGSYAAQWLRAKYGVFGI